MKNNKASGFLRQIISMITAMAKAKTLALKSKTRAIKTRLIIFSLLTNKKILMSSISDKLHTLMGACHHQHHHQKDDDDDNDNATGSGEQRKTIVVQNAMSHESLPPSSPITQAEYFAADHEQVDFENQEEVYEDDDENKYPDLRHSLFDLEMEDPGVSVIDLVKKSKPEGVEFRLEDEIDQVADLFIKRFHLQMRIQKQLSFKNYQEMIQRSA